MQNKNELFTLARKLRKVIPQPNRNSKNLFEIQEGSFLEYDKKTFYVKKSINYQERKKEKVIDSWDECEAICLEDNGKTYFIEVEEDDGLKMYLSHSILKLRDLGIKKNDIGTIINDEKTLKFNGNKFYYEDDYKAYITDSDEEVYFIDFEDEHGNYLTIERYEDGETKVYISSSVSGIEVISL